jgi:hypothetical protein
MDYKHTPGPWIVGAIDTAEETVRVEHPDTDCIIASVFAIGQDYRQEEITEAPANARLIAAAPSMLALLDRLESDWGADIDLDEPIDGADAVDAIRNYVETARALRAAIKE